MFMQSKIVTFHFIPFEAVFIIDSKMAWHHIGGKAI